MADGYQEKIFIIPESSMSQCCSRGSWGHLESVLVSKGLCSATITAFSRLTHYLFPDCWAFGLETMCNILISILLPRWSSAQHFFSDDRHHSVASNAQALMSLPVTQAPSCHLPSIPFGMSGDILDVDWFFSLFLPLENELGVELWHCLTRSISSVIWVP